MTILHELNHYLRRNECRNFVYTECKTNRRLDMDGGELMFEAIFGKEIFKAINEELADTILTIDNWNKQPLEFKKKFVPFLEKKITNDCINCMISNDDGTEKWNCLFPSLESLEKSPDIKV